MDNKPLFSRRKVRIAVYLTAVFLYWASLYLYVPTLPVYVESKTEKLALVGVVLAMYGLWQAIIRLPVGIAADWLGRRKPFIIVGFALSALGALLMGFAPNILAIGVGRAVTGLAAATWVPLVVAFSTLFKPEEAVRATALLTISNSISRMLSTGITGTLNQWGGYSLAFILAATAAGLAILVILPDDEPRKPRKANSRKKILSIITRRDVLLPSLLAAVAQYISWTATFGFLPILAKDMGATEVQLSLLTSMNIAVLLAGNLVLTTIVKRVSTKPLLYLSFFLSSGGILIAAFASSLPVIFVAQFCLGLSFGIGSPILMGKSIERVEDDNRTTAMGLHQSVYAIGMFSGPWLSGILADAIGIPPMFVITAIVCLALGLIGLWWMHKWSDAHD